MWPHSVDQRSLEKSDPRRQRFGLFNPTHERTFKVEQISVKAALIGKFCQKIGIMGDEGQVVWGCGDRWTRIRRRWFTDEKAEAARVISRLEKPGLRVNLNA